MSLKKSYSLFGTLLKYTCEFVKFLLKNHISPLSSASSPSPAPTARPQHLRHHLQLLRHSTSGSTSDDLCNDFYRLLLLLLHRSAQQARILNQVWCSFLGTYRKNMVAASASFRWILQLHKDVPKAAKFYKEGLDFTINVCTLRWAELESGPLKLALMHSSSEIEVQKGYSSLLSFSVTDINSTVTKLMALGAEMDGPIKYEVHGKVAAMRCIDGHMLGLYEPV
uniref:Glyoxalase/fosfomycin resistance/dioxygenase domain-containing protein n=3 Tax=Lactuca TaxID=4235 RepID=A0A9R1V3F0_LACSA|nr:hypothetical protein LSAT_V11C700343510 [Lactuca sativa]